jgi:hypothetical protein
VSAQRIVVTSPWKLGLFVFLLVASCGFGLIYAYFTYFGGQLDFSDSIALRNFYAVCGGVAFLGLLGYLAVVTAAQPANLVANEGRQRRNLMKKAAKIDDPGAVDLAAFQDEPTLVAILERWREDRRLVEEARAQAEAPRELADQNTSDSQDAAPSHEAPASAVETAIPKAAASPHPTAAQMPPQSAEDQLAAVHEELFHPQPQAPAPPAPAPAVSENFAATQPAPAQDEEAVYDLSSFGAVELPAAPAEAAHNERIYDLNEFGAVEL